MVVALPAGSARLAAISDGILAHASPTKHRDQVILPAPGDLPHYANARVRLKGMQGWSVLPFRLLRDYSVVDPWLTHLKSWGCYTYFFLGEPSWWAVKKNVGAFARWGDLGDGLTIYRVAGRDLLACADLLFYRPDDNVVVIRGDYVGPAHVEPAP